MVRPRWWRRLDIPTLVILSATGAWWVLYVPLEKLHDVGLRGPFVSSGRSCWKTPDAKAIRCDKNVWSPVARDQQVVIYSSRTRAVSLVEHIWSVADSVTWQREQDSIRDAMRRRGAKSPTCDEFEASKGRLAEARARTNGYLVGLREVDAWTLPHQEVRLMTYRWQPRERSPGLWELQVVGVGDDRGVCSKQEATRRLLTIEEMMTEWHHWLADQFQF